MNKKTNLEFKFVISLIFAVLVAIFAIQNAPAVQVSFFIWQISISQAIVILISAVIGALIVFLLGLIKQVKQNLKVKQLNKEIEALKSEKEDIQAELDEMIALNNQEIIEEFDAEIPNIEEEISEDIDFVEDTGEDIDQEI